MHASSKSQSQQVESAHNRDNQRWRGRSTGMPSNALRLTLAVAGAVAVMSLSTGCDDSRAADKQVYRLIRESRPADASDEAAAQARATLEEAVKIEGASPAGKAHAARLLAQAEQAEAFRLIDQLQDGQRNAMRLLSEITGLAARIDLVNAQVGSYRQYEPADARTLAEQQTTAVQGGGDNAVWIEAENANIPTLAAVKQEVSRLQGEISKRQEQIKTLQEQRDQAMAQSEELQRKSEGEQGDASVETFREASAARKKGSDLQTQIETLQSQVARLERDLAVAQGQHQAAESAVETYQALIASMNQGWEDVQQLLSTTQSLAGQLAGTNGQAPAEGEDAPMTITAKSQALADQLAANKQVFDAAEQQLGNAIKHFQDAVTAASSFGQNGLPAGVDRNSRIGETSELAKIAMNPDGFRFKEAQARQSLATLHASRALVLNTVMRMTDTLKQTLDTAGIEPPEAISSLDVEGDLDSSKNLANTGFDEAAELFTQVSTSSLTQAQKNAATVGLALARYGQAQVARITGNTTEAQQFLVEARAARDTAIDNGASLPAMPPELVPAPTTRPATAPATAPAATDGSGRPANVPPTDAAAPPADPTAPPADPAAPPVDPAAPPAPSDPAAPEVEAESAPAP